ncbi:MAG TPA: sodium/glutamate symporter, partial [Amaricoccus sp.]|nr:sodium/glutamate symporter [Amaricoccus sp.]
MQQIVFPDFMAITFGLVTYLIGEAINDRVPLLRRFNIPDPVTGGLLVAFGFWLLYETGVAEVSFDTHARDLLLLVFFTGIGLNARLADLVKGGRPLGILVGLTAVLLLLQNLVGFLGAWIAGLPLGLGAVLGSTSLLGGHGTIIAWSPELAARGLTGAPEIGIAVATLGLVVGSVVVSGAHVYASVL